MHRSQSERESCEEKSSIEVLHHTLFDSFTEAEKTINIVDDDIIISNFTVDDDVIEIVDPKPTNPTKPHKVKVCFVLI